MNKKGFAILGLAGVIALIAMIITVTLYSMSDQSVSLNAKLRESFQNYNYAEFGICRAIWRIDLPDSTIAVPDDYENDFSIPDSDETADIHIHENSSADYTITSTAKDSEGNTLREIIVEYEGGKDSFPAMI